MIEFKFLNQNATLFCAMRKIIKRVERLWHETSVNRLDDLKIFYLSNM